jgi:hypothetical protein
MSGGADKIPKGIFNIQWKRKAPWILSYLAMDKRPKSMPAIVRKYGVKHFKEKKGYLYVYGRRVVVEPKEVHSVLEGLEEGYGGYQAAYSRIQRHYVGVTLRAIQSFFNRSERRQLKRPKGSVDAQKTFIATSKAGSIEADCMFFRGSGTKLITVFGFVDQFSRWVFYKTIPNKTPWSTGAALREGIEEFEKLMGGGRVWQCRTDFGSEFKHDPRNKQLPKAKQQVDFAGYCKTRKIKLISKKQPARTIESTNLRLRRHIERIQYGTRRELTMLVRRFCQEKNETKHSATRMAPVDALALDVEKTKKLAKAQLERGRKRIAKKANRPGKPKHVLAVKDLVRMQLASEKTKLGHAGPKPTWSKTIYRILKIVGSTRGANRYKIAIDSSNKKVDGLFFGWRLQHIVKPTHNIGTKLKYDPGAAKEGDVHREEEARRPDLIKGSEWVKKKPNYKDAQDAMDSDGEEFVGEEDDDAKLSEPPKKKKPQVKKEKKLAPLVKAIDVSVLKKSNLKEPKKKEKKKYRIIGRKVFAYWDDEEWKSPVVVLMVYREFYVVLWADKTISAIDARKDGDVSRTTDEFWPQKTVQKYIDLNTKQISVSKKHVDDILEGEK